MEKIFWFFIFFLQLFWCLAQGGQPFFEHYTTDQGLPSPEVYEILQDSKGYLWFGTDNGVSRFNGYEFENFGFEDGLRNNVVFHLKEDEGGRIWMGTMSGNLYYFENDSIYAYKYNNILEKYKEDFHSITGILIDADTVFIGLYDLGILEILPDGSASFPFQKGEYRLEIVERSGGILSCRRWQPERKQLIYADNLYLDFKSEKLSKSLPLPCSESRNTGSRTTKTGDHYIISCRFNMLVFDQDFNLVAQKNNPDKPAEISGSENGEIYVGLNQKMGVRLYKNMEAFLRDDFLYLLEGYSVTHVVRDYAGGYWFSTLEDGVFYCPNRSYLVYNENFGFHKPNIKALAVKDKYSFFAVADNGEIFEINSESPDTSMRLPIIDEPEINDMVYDSANQRLWVGGHRLRYLDGKEWKYIDDTTSYCGYVLAAKRLWVSRDTRSLWGCYSWGTLEIDNQKKEIDYRSSDFGINQRTLCFYEDPQLRRWVGTTSGLFELVNNQLVPPKINHPLFSIRVEDIAELKDGSMVIATKGGGIGIWKDSSLIQINQKMGLTSNMVECLFVDEAQKIWVGTLNGLNTISFDPDSGKPIVENYTFAHGLPSNEINDVCVIGNKAWVATSRGLVQLGESSGEQFVSPPLLRAILVNNQSINLEEPTVFSYQENNLQFHFLTINYKLSGNIHYRYRLGSQEKWNYTTNTSVNFLRLPPGNYAFELQSQEESGIWGKPLIVEFGILHPFWQQPLFLIGLILGLVLLVGWLYKRRIHQIRKEATIEREVNTLKQSALQAQMNPHFVFNCLNAIQNFIATDEKIKAGHYLSRFAKLVRSTLHLSMEPLITLEEDIEILKNYLELEKIRFKNRFEYQMVLGENISAFDILIPPLLLQPYVENAIIHGLSNSKGKGQIDIHYFWENMYLVMEVSDNGIGIFQSQAQKSNTDRLHKSVGMSISRKRLKLLDTTNNLSSVIVNECMDSEGKVSGTKVRMRLDLKKIVKP